jgi:hypothetical protein
VAGPSRGSYGRLTYPPLMKMSAATRNFLSHVRKTSGCWFWIGTLNDSGYGRIGNDRAHRVSWRRSKGPIPKGKCVLHRCDVRRCVRPSHLFLGTRRQNTRDMLRKRRHAHGRRHGSTHLTEARVRSLKRLRRQGWTIRRLGKRFRVSPQQASKICLGQYWSHVS